MFKVNIFDPASVRGAFGHADEKSNYALIISPHVFTELRNTALIDLHIRRAMSARPYYYFNGPAEMLLLSPMSQLILSNIKASTGTTTPDVRQFLLDMTSQYRAVTRVLATLRGRQPSSALTNMITALQPDLKYPAGTSLTYTDLAKNPGSFNAYAEFSSFYHGILSEAKERDNLLKSVLSGRVDLPNASSTTPANNFTIIQDTITALEIAGTAGKGQQVAGLALQNALASRAVYEAYLTADTTDTTLSRNQFVAGIWYLMFSQIVQTPESYDSMMPPVPPTAQDGQVTTGFSRMVGSIAKTAYGVAISADIFEMQIVIKQMEEMLEFLLLQPNPSSDTVGKIQNDLSHVKGIVSASGYPPVITLANTVFDYVKRITGARYLLPEFIRDLKTSTGARPFSRPTTSLPDSVTGGFRGYFKDAQRVIDFGGFDVPYFLGIMQNKTSVLSGLASNLQLHLNATQADISVVGGDYLVHLDTLGSLEPDPPIGSVDYPKPTDIFVVPSYMPKYVEDANGQPQWSLTNKLYKLFLPKGVGFKQMTTNIVTSHYSWDTEIVFGVSPATGSNFSTLLVPSCYVEDCNSYRIPNVMASVRSTLASSPNRPVKEIADFFIPLFQALSGGLVRADVVSNAVCSMFFVYERLETGDGGINSTTSWKLIKPQISHIYGARTNDFIERNKVGSGYAAVTSDRVYLAADGKHMAVLHRSVPRPTHLRYLPFIMAGGITVSMPVAKSHYDDAVKTAGKFIASGVTAGTVGTDSMKAWFGKLQESIEGAKYDDWVTIKGWAPMFGSFPHIFFTNRNAAGVLKQVLAEAPNLMYRFSALSDMGTPFGGINAYFPTPTFYLDIADENENLLSPESTMNLDEEIKAKKTKAKTGAPDLKLPTDTTKASSDVLNKTKTLTPEELSTAESIETTVVSDKIDPPIVKHITVPETERVNDIEHIEVETEPGNVPPLSFKKGKKQDIKGQAPKTQ